MNSKNSAASGTVTALATATESAQEMLDAGRPGEAEALLRNALPTADDDRRVELLLLLGQALREQQYQVEGVAALAEALAYAPTADEDPRQHARAHVALSFALINLGQADQALEHANAAWTCLPRLTEPLLRVRLTNALALAQTKTGLYEQAMFHYRQVLRETRLSPKMQDERRRAMINIGVCCDEEALSLPSDDPRRARLWRRQVRCCRYGEAFGIRVDYTAIARLNRASALLHLGETALAGVCIQASAGGIEGDGEGEMAAYLMALRGRLAFALGDHSAAAEYLQSAIAKLTTLGVGETIPEFFEMLSSVHEASGALAQALAALRRCIALRDERARDKTRNRTLVLDALFRVERMRQALDTARQQVRDSDQKLGQLEADAERLVHTAHTDALTGLGNRRSLDMLAASFNVVGAPAYSLVMLDLDHFKRINDGHSHAVGDKVLRQVALLLLAGSRSNDSVVRYGGEEMALVMPLCSAADARRKCEILRVAIEDHRWDEIAPGLVVTASFGVATSGSDSFFSEVLARADAQLYRAKALGRNCVAADEASLA